jgi:hypothetical protein
VVVQCIWIFWPYGVADEAFGGNSAFLDGVAGLGLGYLTEVAHTTRVWEERPATHMPPWRGRSRRPPRERLEEGAPEAQTVLGMASALPAEAWTRQTIKEGSQGPIPTVSLDVISLVASSCGYYKGQIEHRIAQ